MPLNKVLLIGFVPKAPEIHYLSSNVPGAKFVLGTTERGYTTKEGKRIPDQTEWHYIEAYREQARFVEQWVKPGSLLLVEGKLRYHTYTDNQGNTRRIAQILAQKISFYESDVRSAPAGLQHS